MLGDEWLTISQIAKETMQAGETNVPGLFAIGPFLLKMLEEMNHHLW